MFYCPMFHNFHWHIHGFALKKYLIFKSKGMKMYINCIKCSFEIKYFDNIPVGSMYKGLSLPIGIKTIFPMIKGIRPTNISSFRSSNFLANGPIQPKQVTPTRAPQAMLIPRYRTACCLVHAHWSIARGV